MASHRSSSRLSNRVFSALGLLALSNASVVPVSKCRCFPGDSCWPSDSVWSDFNRTVGGKLIKTIPLATPCHDPSYNAGTCTSLQSEWLMPEVQSVLYTSEIQVLHANAREKATTRPPQLWPRTSRTTVALRSRQRTPGALPGFM